jgi:hypothetical protein
MAMGEVRLDVPYGSYEERMAAEEMRKTLSGVGDVMFDPPASVGATKGTIYMYGPDADQLFEDIKAALAGDSPRFPARARPARSRAPFPNRSSPSCPPS